MSFKLLKKTTRADHHDGIRISSGFSKDGTAEITMSFGVEVQELFGLKAGDHLACYLGEGEDKGLFRLVKAPKNNGDGYALMKGGKQSRSLRFKRTVGKGWLSSKNASTNCPYRLGSEAGVLEIELPEWAGGPVPYRYRDQKIVSVQPKPRTDEKGRPVKAISQ